MWSRKTRECQGTPRPPFTLPSVSGVNVGMYSNRKYLKLIFAPGGGTATLALSFQLEPKVRIMSLRTRLCL